MGTEIKHENTKTALMVFLITQNTHIKISKHRQRQSFFFIFPKAKNIILLYIKIEKMLNTLV